MRPGYLRQISIKPPKALAGHRARNLRGHFSDQDFILELEEDHDCLGAQCLSGLRGLGDFGRMSGAQKWYFGQHAKVCSAMKNRDLKQAITDAAGLNDLGVEGKKYEEVIASRGLLQAFKEAFNGFKGKMQSYDDETLKIANELFDVALGNMKASYQDGSWRCPGIKPESEAESYYKCCPEGWVKLGFNTQECPDQGLFTCGPVPAGMDRKQLVCCTRMKKWTPVDPTGKDPCAEVQITAEQILAPELVIERPPLVTPTMMGVGALATISLIAFTFLIR